MISVVSGSSITVTTTVPRTALNQFVAGLRWRHVFNCCCGVFLRSALLLCLPVLLSYWLIPSVWATTAIFALWTVGLVVTTVGICAWVRSRHILPAIRQSMSEGGASMHALGDELATWLEFDRGNAANGSRTAAGMLRWLEQDVHERLAPHRARALTMAARPRLGRWVWLLRVVLLLLLAWVLSLWLSPFWPGLLGGKSDQATEFGGTSANAETRAEGTLSGSRVEGQKPEPVPEPVPGPEPTEPEGVANRPTPVPKDRPGDDAEPPDEEPPLIEAPDDRRFVVPDFIGDGPKRRALMRVAELEEQAARARSEQALSPAVAKPDTSVPQAPELTFERAAEEALRARHVPAVERAMVRRFFDKLREKAK